MRMPRDFVNQANENMAISLAIARRFSPGEPLERRQDSRQRKMRGTTALPLVPRSIAARAAVKSVSLGLVFRPSTCCARAKTPAKPRHPAAQACHSAPRWLTRSVYSPLEPAKSTKPPELSARCDCNSVKRSNTRSTYKIHFQCAGKSFLGIDPNQLLDATFSHTIQSVF